ncbi:O-antigen ligase family protein [Nocardioides xinjiangensis]|uniref:O-antigen ligase family protein n=1 Tax=Nocardioides xinjiangensis TaxID=2817376 RepID=UPI001B30F396|nr:MULTISPECIES: O-antigen ligase family protein [unclassified Nocardioides]
MSDTTLPLSGGRVSVTVATTAAAVCCGIAAALTAVGIAGRSTLLALVPVVVCAGIIIGAIALARFAVFVLLMLLIRASIDAFQLSPGAGSRLLTPSTIVGVFFIAAAALWLVVAYRQRGGLPGSRLRTALVALVCVSLVSVPGAVNPQMSLTSVMRLLAIVLMFAVLEQLMVDPRMMRRALVVVFCSAIFPIAYTVAGHVTGNPPVEVKGDVTRLVGTFAQSNAFGAYLMLLIIMGVAVFSHTPGRIRAGLSLLLAACAVCLVLTYTLAALLGVLFGLIVVGIRQSRRLLLWVGTVLGLAVMIVPTLSDRLGAVAASSTYAAQGSAHAGNSLAWRLSYWSEIAHLADRNPATGVGYGMTSHLTQEGKQPHNDYLRAYVETGVLGLLVYLAVIVLLIRLGLGAVRKAPPGTLDRAIAVGYLGCAVALALTSVASNKINGVAQLWYFVTFAAAASAVLRRGPSAPTPEHEATAREV